MSPVIGVSRMNNARLGIAYVIPVAALIGWYVMRNRIAIAAKIDDSTKPDADRDERELEVLHERRPDRPR